MPIPDITIFYDIIHMEVYYDNKTYSYDLVVHEDIEKASYFKVFSNLLKDVFSGDRARSRAN